MRANELAALLAQRAEAVAEYLLPNGQRSGSEWQTGNIDDLPGDSLRVHLTGSKAGVWKDFASDEGGDLVGLWMTRRGKSLRDACVEIEQWLGVAQSARLEKPVYRQPASWKTPTRSGVTRLIPEHEAWLTETRCIPAETIAAYRVASRDGRIMFPYLLDDKLVFAKYRNPFEKKDMRVDSGCRPCLFGWQAIPQGARILIITEGEMDALAMHAYGHPAVSVPFGGGRGAKQAWIEQEFDHLESYDTIYVCMDDDDEGAAAALEIVQRLGLDRCRVVKFPRKDANQCLMEGVPKDAIDAALGAGRLVNPDRFRFLSDYHHEIDAILDAWEHGEPGIRLPWEVPNEPLLLRNGEVSIWAGIDGHGKSAVVQQIMLYALGQELDEHPVRACVATLEYRPEAWALRIIRQALGVDPAYDRERTHRALDRLAQGCYIFDAGKAVSGTVDLEDVLEVFSYAARCYGARLFILDNLTRLDFAEDDSRGQKALINRLCGWAVEMNVHLMVVAHTRKTDRGESAPPGKQDIRGHGAFSNSPGTVVLVWRNKPKEKLLRDGTHDPEVLAEADTLLVTTKQRSSLGHEPTIKLWFDMPSQQFRGRPEGYPAPLPFMDGI